MQPERYPLPFGWIKQTDPSGRSFYVRFCLIARRPAVY